MKETLNGAFSQEAHVAGPESWRWFRNDFSEKEIEGIIYSAQEYTLRTYWIKYSIDKEADSPLFRLCEKTTKSVQHIVSGCT